MQRVMNKFQCNAKVELFDFRGRNAIFMASSAGHKDILIRLINYIGSQPNHRNVANEQTPEPIIIDLKPLWFDQDFLTPLHFAAAKGHTNCLEILYQLSDGIKPGVNV